MFVYTYLQTVEHGNAGSFVCDSIVHTNHPHQRQFQNIHVSIALKGAKHSPYSNLS